MGEPDWFGKIGFGAVRAGLRWMCAMIARLPVFQRLVLGLLSDSFLNSLDLPLSRMEFVHAESLSIGEALRHTYWYRPAEARLRREYWQEIDNQNISARGWQDRNSGTFTWAWYDDLVRYWIILGELHPITVNDRESVLKTEWQAVLRKRGIPWPPTWR